VTTPPATDAERFAQETRALLGAISTGTWVPPGLNAGGDLSALDPPYRPVNQLIGAGLGWLVPHVQPLQSVLDRLAGQAAAIQTFADTWREAAEKIEEVRSQFQARVRTETQAWFGLAGRGYRSRARELTAALDGAAQLAMATGVLAMQLGEVVADARRQVNELLTDLVQRLISYATQAVAAQGGTVTPEVVAQCTQMINSYSGPIAEIERKLEQAMATIRPPTLPTPPGPSTFRILVDALGDVLNTIGGGFVLLGGIFRRRGGGQRRRPRNVTEAQMATAILNSRRTRIGQVQPPSRWPADTAVGREMHARIDPIVRARWPHVQFTRQQARGPDLPVVQRPGQRDPGFDWVEIKPHSQSGIEEFVRTQWGQNAMWSGRGRLITYDRHGNIYEIHFPIRTGP
jgi:hypothetical protein